MSDEMYDDIEPTARLLGVLMARLQGLESVTIGGMKFENLQSGL